MSLVTTAMSSRSRSRLQSESTRAVLPEPTGPPTPTRSTLRWGEGNDSAGVAMRLTITGLLLSPDLPWSSTIVMFPSPGWRESSRADVVPIGWRCCTRKAWPDRRYDSGALRLKLRRLLPYEREMLCLDLRLAGAARREGFRLAEL